MIHVKIPEKFSSLLKMNNCDISAGSCFKFNIGKITLLNNDLNFFLKINDNFINFGKKPYTHITIIHVKYI